MSKLILTILVVVSLLIGISSLILGIVQINQIKSNSITTQAIINFLEQQIALSQQNNK